MQKSYLLFMPLLLTACASTPPESAARPVFYPNATMERMGKAGADQAANMCMDKAQSAGLSPALKDNSVGKSAAGGAAMGGVAGIVGALVTGRNMGDALEHGMRGAAVGGATGAVAGSFKDDKINPTYRQFVQRCLSDKGLDVIGWQ